MYIKDSDSIQNIRKEVTTDDFAKFFNIMCIIVNTRTW